MTDMPKAVRVPRDVTGRNELLALKPGGWEYLYFGSVLLAGLEKTEVKWRDYRLGITLHVGERVRKNELADVLSDMFSAAQVIAGRLTPLLSEETQREAFGLPGEPGDEDLIAHLGNRLIDMYEQLLDWAEGLRALRLDPAAKPVQDIGVLFISQPVQEVRDFIGRYVAAIEEAATEYVEGAEPRHIVLELNFEIAPEVPDRFNRALETAIA